MLLRFLKMKMASTGATPSCICSTALAGTHSSSDHSHSYPRLIFSRSQVLSHTCLLSRDSKRNFSFYSSFTPVNSLVRDLNFRDDCHLRTNRLECIGVRSALETPSIPSSSGRDSQLSNGSHSSNEDVNVSLKNSGIHLENPDWTKGLAGHVKKHHKPDRMQSSLVLMRHGESMWNHLKLFTGDVDIPLTEKGVMEALTGGKSVSEIDFDMIFTSRLVRSKQTALIAMTQNKYKAVPVIVRGGYHGTGKTGDENRLRLRFAAAQALEQADCRMIPVYADQALNERCYGDLQGMSKEVAMKQFGKDVVQKWRRSHDTKPPRGESLMDTMSRSLKFFDAIIMPRLKDGNNVLVVAHGNVLRCIISHLAGLTESEMLGLQILTALPYSYTFNGDEFDSCRVLPPIDLKSNEPMEGAHLGLASVVKKNQMDSLI